MKKRSLYIYRNPNHPWLEDLVNWNIQHGSIMATPEGERYANEIAERIAKEKANEKT